MFNKKLAEDAHKMARQLKLQYSEIDYNFQFGINVKFLTTKVDTIEKEIKLTCSTCGKIIEHPYYLDGKVYGYNCYKLAVALKYAKQMEIRNNNWTKKSIAVIEIFKNKVFKDKWNKDFQESIIKQWDTYSKLTGNQFKCIIKKLTELEEIEYNFLYLSLLKEENEIEEITKYLYYRITEQQKIFKTFKNDNRFINIIANYRKGSIKRGKNFFIVEFRDIDEVKSICQVLREDKLKLLKKDEYTEIIEIIKVS